jgi:DNA excision repair protein ERCC-4
MRGLQSDLTLLSLHFPKLRILWSPSAHASAKLFAQLKSQQAQPDPAVAMGLDDDQFLKPALAAANIQRRAVAWHPIASDVLQRLPGCQSEVTARYLMRQARDLVSLGELSLDRLKEIMGHADRAQELHEFLHGSSE